MSRKTDATITATATEPTATTTEAATPAPAKQTPAERKAALIARRDAVRAEGGVWRNAAGNPDARGLGCLCGCGEPTHRDEAMFRSGHDAILRGHIITAERDGGQEAAIAAIPAIIRGWFDLGAPIAGLLLEDGKIRDVKNGGF